MKTYRIAFCSLLLLAVAFPAAAEYTFSKAEGEAIKPRLDELLGNANSAMVVGLVDEQGTKVFSAGKLDNGTDQEVSGDSVFFIGSVTKTFTTLLLLDMVDRGEMKLDDPAAKYLPKSVKMPSYGRKEITLLDLATHTAGLPINPDNMTGADAREQYETYTVEKMYAFLSGYVLSRDPGTEFEYSNVGMALLGQVIALKAGANYDSLVVERICRPLGMNDTCVRLTPELQVRLAMGHDESGKPSRPWNLDAYVPAGALHSTANDLLKYAAANAGLTQARLTPLMVQSHIFRHVDSHGIPGAANPTFFGRTAMDWVDRGAVQPPGMDLLGHAGGAGSYHAWVGFDQKQRRGVVVLTTANDLSAEAVGWTLLQRMPLTRDSVKDFAHEMVGIGVALDLDKLTRTLLITKVVANSPASQAGLSAGLLIQKIDNASTTGKSLTRCVDLIRGPAGTKVRLELFDPKRNETKMVELTREKFVTSNS
jgi:serine-type D-Ala-D-Ala carboxypeptidase/endopeptidase